ncbi:HHR198Cp [Eremothecium sinecaudum]|uniref:HHR198Cp n=1 Tax=Eremothecium sinecaudum TaxID=45286 RepID=A0A109V0L3_9SACH|nr:HHR198Cp [Eremothecium sinecaudum]AMD22967.1 HHR198Cp [Eremothecium sinecaudum]
MVVGKGAKRGAVDSSGNADNSSISSKLPAKLMDVKLNSRPRRFSLIYSSDESSLSNVSEGDEQRKRIYKNGKRPVGRGKSGRLIQDTAADSNNDSERTDSSSYVKSHDTNGDDDDEDDDESSSMSSSDDDVDFVRLTAERKKRALKALNAMKLHRESIKASGRVAGKYPAGYAAVASYRTNREKTPLDDDFPSDSSKNDDNALSFNFKKGDGIQFGGKGDGYLSQDESDEDLGEEVYEKERKSGGKTVASESTSVDHLGVPQISETEESEYDFDQDAYFKTLEEDAENVTGMDTGLETGDDDMAILEEEEQNMMQQLENDDDISFDGSIHEEGDDPVDNEENVDEDAARNNTVKDDPDGDDDDYDDEIMSDFDMPFYEDPKFANLYYSDNREQPLSLSVSLPLILNDEKRRRQELKKKKLAERVERLRRPKLIEKERSATPDIGSDDYVFGLFFNSDGESNAPGNIGIDSAIRRLNAAKNFYENSSAEEEYENILLDIAHMPTEDEDDDSIEVDDEDIDITGASDIEDDDDVSMSHIFIDIDDLDPDAFYFQYGSSSDRESSGKSMDLIRHPSNVSDNSVEDVVYMDNESTDEDETLPPHNSRTRKIGSKAKEVVSANTVGLKPPRLGTWKADTKPFSIIDGLSTKSLLPLIQEHQQLLEAQNQQPHIVENMPVVSNSDVKSDGEPKLTINDLLNMSELDDDESQVLNFGNYENKPKVPLSAFRNKGINVYEDEEYTLPIFSARKFPIGYVGSERTRRKIDRMKELQQKKQEKRRKLRKRKKLLKLKRKRALDEKERALKGDEVDSASLMSGKVTLGDGEVDQNGNLPILGSDGPLQGTLASPNTPKSPGKPTDMDEINQLLVDDDGILTAASHGSELYITDSNDIDMLASLTAPISCAESNDPTNSITAMRRRHSLAEAAAGNLRFTKSGLFSESALADLDEMIGNSNNGHMIEFSKVLQ